ncbi:hypothetical protein HOB87_10565 [Candidatus Woesearchaeota archaeon]|jgi:hypothetical protein|nr:hypothetical protein [Candidatus Woesearchaeota archaeon]
MNKFENVPVEEDTKIILRQEMSLGKYSVLYEYWSWDGIMAHSVIFVESDLGDCSDSEIEDLIRATSLLKDKDSEITMKHVKGFVFVNFNFEIS